MSKRIETVVLKRFINGNCYELVRTCMDVEYSLEIYHLVRNSKPIFDPRTKIVYVGIMDDVAYFLKMLYSDVPEMLAELTEFHEMWRKYDDAKGEE
jgi:hypothetical protein